MSECVLCLSRVTKAKIVKLVEKVTDGVSLEDAIRANLSCLNSLDASSIACKKCFKSFKSFYDFLNEINSKHTLPIIKTEKPEPLPSDVEEIEFKSTQPVSSSNSIKVEDAASTEEENRFDDSDFEWSMDDEDFTVDRREASIESDAVAEKPAQEINQTVSKIKRKVKVENEEKPIKRACSKGSTYVRYLKRSQITEEMLASNSSFVVIDGVEYKIPRIRKHPTKKVTKEPKVDLDALERKLARDPNRRLHPSFDPEGEAKIRSFVAIKCHVCGVELESFFRLKKHFKHAHPHASAYLECCGRKFTRRFHLLDHIEFHDKSAIHKCEECNKTYKSRGCLRAHRRHMHEAHAVREMCAVCGRICSNHGALKTHMLTHVVSEKIFECYACKSGRTYKNEALLRKHLQTRHNHERPDTSVVCHICCATFRASHLATHMRTVHSEGEREKVQCKICGFWLLATTLKVHLLKHNDQGVTCGECGKFLKSKYSLSGHMKVAHSTDYKFTCTYCAKGFHKENKMIEHVAVKHTRDFPFTCRVPECGKGFRAEGNWRIHEKKAHPEEYEAFFKPFYKRNPSELVGEGV